MPWLLTNTTLPTYIPFQLGLFELKAMQINIRAFDSMYKFVWIMRKNIYHNVLCTLVFYIFNIYSTLKLTITNKLNLYGISDY